MNTRLLDKVNLSISLCCSSEFKLVKTRFMFRFFCSNCGTISARRQISRTCLVVVEEEVEDDNDYTAVAAESDDIIIDCAAGQGSD